MNSVKLTLLACPLLLASTLLRANPASATDAVIQNTNNLVPASTTPVFEVVFERPTTQSLEPELTNKKANVAVDLNDCGCSDETPMLNFTNEDSTAAIKRYGCDCAGCINALRQLQGKLPLL